MARKCTICQHADRDNMDRAIVAGVSYRDISGRYRVSRSAINRHRVHIPAAMAKSQEAQEIARGDALLAQVEQLRTKAGAILDKAERAGELKTALLGIREARGCLELLAKLLGELKEAPTVNIVLMPEWITLRTAILHALEPYPAARQAVAEAIKALRAGG